MNERDLKKRTLTDWARIDQMTDDDIDTSDIPPLDDGFFARAKWRLPATITLIQELLAPRITKNCVPQFRGGYFKGAAHEAMIQVELALKEKGRVEGTQFGVNLIKDLFGRSGVTLRVPLGQELQADAEKFFIGVFKYYRNYAAHDGSKIDQRIALRILILASELLELIDASELTLADSGDVEGLVRVGGFENAGRLGELLALLDHYTMPAGTYDGLFEGLAMNGFKDEELTRAVELNLIEMHSGEGETSFDSPSETEVMEWFELTKLGREALESIKAEAK